MKKHHRAALIPSFLPTKHGRCRNVSETYKKINRIGEGTYGTVYRARRIVTNDVSKNNKNKYDGGGDNDDKMIVALKRCILHHEASDGFPLTSLREISILQKLKNHPNIVDLIEIVVSDSRSGVFLVFEYCEHDLSQLIDNHYHKYKRSPFRESEVKQLTVMLLGALEYMHSLNIIHRDLKLSNLLYNSRGQLKVADFGLARTISSSCSSPADDSSFAKPTLTPKVVSLWYRPPELLLLKDNNRSIDYKFEVDMWAVGCIIAELLLGLPLFDGKSELAQIEKISDILNQKDLEHPVQGSYPFRLADLLAKVVSQSSVHPSIEFIGMKLLNVYPRARPSASLALKSIYFQTIPFPQNPSLMPTFPTIH